MTSRTHDRRGQSLVESALVTLVFLTLLIGVLDVGQVLFVHQTLVERARHALRWGTVRPFDATAIRNIVLYNRSALADGNPPGPGLFNLTPGMVSVTRQDASLPADRIVLRISGYPFRFYTPFIAGLYQGRPIVLSIPYEGG